MSTATENKYGSFEVSNLFFVNAYGVADDEYGVVNPDPYIYSFLLAGDISFLLQENGDKIIL